MHRSNRWPRPAADEQAGQGGRHVAHRRRGVGGGRVSWRVRIDLTAWGHRWPVVVDIETRGGAMSDGSRDASSVPERQVAPVRGASHDLDAALDRAYLVRTLSQLATVPTAVPLGYETLMEPDDPKLVHYVQRVVRPALVEIGAYDLIEAGNNLVVVLGSGESGRSLLIQNYTVAQHFNLMEDPFSGKVGSGRGWGVDEPVVYGQGVSQGKAHQAVMLTVLKLLLEQGVSLHGRLYWAINNEGRSSHGCSEAIFEALGEVPSFGIIQLGTGLRLSLGNRGRVDVNVHVKGKASHSSAPEAGHSAIDGAHEVISRLRTLSWTDRHPILGGRHAIVYKLRFEPVAPHTLPSDAYLTVDRRLLPGDDVDAATREIRAVLDDMPPYQVDVERGVHMLPALVDPDSPWVGSIQAAHVAVRGAPAETIYGQGTFDAGGPCALGTPTVMYGATGGVWPTGVDFVPISAAEAEARVLTCVILDQLGQG
jgi:acetylornithine deacetylase/succinyl-diaminopimelate desuccinylase-like protein